MRLIDIHIHVAKREHLTNSFLEYFVLEYGEQALTAIEGLTPAKFEKFLDVEGVDAAVLLSEYSPQVTGVVPNEFTVKFAAKSKKLIPFGSIDINSSIQTGDQAQHALIDLNCKGLKLLPSYGYYHPNDPRMYGAYEVAQKLDSIVMFHTGTSLFPKTRVRFADPLLLDDVAVDFPKLKIVMCHGGRPFWYQESEWMLRRHPNLFIDISGVPPFQLPKNFSKLEKFHDRYLFGSDWPNVTSIRSQAEQVRKLPFKQEVIDAILWGNAARILKLDK
ncbi:MAG: amidohydrolase family protein [Desulfomonilaceae bacterium]